MSRSHLGPDQIFGTERYHLHNQIWSGPWADKDFGADQIGFVNGASVLFGHKVNDLPLN